MGTWRPRELSPPDRISGNHSRWWRHRSWVMTSDSDVCGLIATAWVNTITDFFCSDQQQCRINYGSGGSPEPGPLNSGASFHRNNFYTYKIYKKIKTVHWSVYTSWNTFVLKFRQFSLSSANIFSNRCHNKLHWFRPHHGASLFI